MTWHGHGISHDVMSGAGGGGRARPFSIRDSAFGTGHWSPAGSSQGENEGKTKVARPGSQEALPETGHPSGIGANCGSQQARLAHSLARLLA